MTDRREFLGAVAAVFCGVVLPEPSRELIYFNRPFYTWSRHGEYLLMIDEAPAVPEVYAQLVDGFWAQNGDTLQFRQVGEPKSFYRLVPQWPHAR